MKEDTWSAVDHYIEERIVGADAALEAALESSAEAGLPAINVSPPQGKLLMMLAQLRGARSALEVGTLGGYSAIWIARGLAPGGRLVTLESNSVHANVARSNLVRAGVADRVEVRVGPARETLPTLMGDVRVPFDLTFIDADKPNNATYFDWAVKLSRPGSLIVVDNVVRGGAVVDHTNDDPSVRGTRELFDRLRTDTRVTCTAIQTVGIKGYDGFVLAVVKPQQQPS
jgi:predicted O-methyltransferase YrrM